MIKTFEFELGRAYNGVQSSCKRTASQLDINISLERYPSLLSINYIMTLDGSEYSIHKFIQWFNKNYTTNDDNSDGYNEQEEEF